MITYAAKARYHRFMGSTLTMCMRIPIIPKQEGFAGIPTTRVIEQQHVARLPGMRSGMLRSALEIGISLDQIAATAKKF